MKRSCAATRTLDGVGLGHAAPRVPACRRSRRCRAVRDGEQRRRGRVQRRRGRGPDDPRAGADASAAWWASRASSCSMRRKPDGTPRKLLDVSKLGADGLDGLDRAGRRHPRDVCGLSRHAMTGAFSRRRSRHEHAPERGHDAVSTSREDKKMTASVTIFHNVVWSRHKGAVLSALHNISGSGSIRYSMVQIADTEHDRARLLGCRLFVSPLSDEEALQRLLRRRADLAHDRAAHVGSAEGEVRSRRAAGLSPSRILGDDGRVHRDGQASRGVLRFDRRATGRAAC